MPSETLPLFLAPDRARPEESLATTLLEILYLPRTQRSEYVENPLPTPPWDIRRLLLEYAIWSTRVDDLLSALTKGFCARGCDRLPVGCCSVLGYDMGLVPAAMLQAQELEARARGWTPPAQEDVCKYHSPRGCCLRLFKSPACAGMLCEALVADLRGRHDPALVEAFLAPLARFRNHPLDRAAIFDNMAEVVAAGRRLLL